MISWMLVAAHAATPAAEYRPFAVELRGSYAVVDKAGVADALRVGLSVAHRGLWTPGPFAVGVAVPVAYGHSEAAGYSYRWGLQAELARPIPAEQLAPYASVGLHYFVSQGWDEVRLGPMWRAALGLRMFSAGAWELGFEPLALERLPNGPGPASPLRSRFVWDVTFLTLGATW